MKLLKFGPRLLLALLVLVLSHQVRAEGDAAAGATKAHTCLGCHGIKHYVNTYPTYHVPRIAGQHETYLIAALQAYRANTREHPTMQANAGLLSDRDIADIAAWFSTQGSGELLSHYSAGDTAAGKSKSATCAACHAETGLSAVPTNPILAGQYESYLQQALKSYRAGTRQNAIMAGFATQLTDQDIADLAAWFSSQESPLVTAPID